MKKIAKPAFGELEYVAIVHGRAPADFRRVPDVPPYHYFVRVDEGLFLGESPDGELYEGGPGDVLYFPKGVPRDTWNDPDRRFAGLVLMFEGTPRDRSVPPRVHDHDGRLRVLTQWLCESTRPLIPGQFEDIGLGLLQAVIAEYQRLAKRPTNPMVVAVRQYATSRLHERLTLAELAAVVGVSRYHFSRLYKDQAGNTPMADVRIMRLEAARDLLMSTNLPLKAIAKQVGLSDASHLARLFRAHFGVGTRSFRS